MDNKKDLTNRPQNTPLDRDYDSVSANEHLGEPTIPVDGPSGPVSPTYHSHPHTRDIEINKDRILLTNPQKGVDSTVFAMVGGILMMALGALAIFMPGSTLTLPVLAFDTNYGLFLSTFPMNILNKTALLVVGLIGVVCSSQVSRSVTWSRFVFAFMGLAAILGLIPATMTLFGYMPLYGVEVVAHAVIAACGAYFGWGRPSENMYSRSRVVRSTRM